MSFALSPAATPTNQFAPLSPCRQVSLPAAQRGSHCRGISADGARASLPGVRDMIADQADRDVARSRTIMQDKRGSASV